MVVVYILIFILVLGLVVCFHELGHYFWAKKNGILVNEFAFGMGPKIVSKKKGETYWSIRAFPIGGFCAMAGEEVGAPLLSEGDQVKLVFDDKGHVSKIVMTLDLEQYKDIEITTVEKADLYGENMAPLYINDYEVNRDAVVVVKREENQIAPHERNFFAKGVWQRFMVCLGGPLNNFILGIFVFLLMAFIMGVPNYKTNKISEFNGIAATESDVLIKGDEIIKIGDYEIKGDLGFVQDSNQEGTISYALAHTHTRTLNITYIRNGETKNSKVYAQYAFNSLGFMSYYKDSDASGKGIEINDSNINDVMVITETKAALGGTSKTKAYQADNGLRNGDIIAEIRYFGDNEVEYTTYQINSWDDLINFATGITNPDILKGGNISIGFIRDGGDIDYTGQYQIYSEKLMESQGYTSFQEVLGVSTNTKFSFFGSIWNGIKYFGKAAGIIFSTLWLLITSKEVGIRDMGGFITILNQTASYAAGGFTSLLYFIGLLSVNLGIINLLPIPALDGGRILFLLIEGITHKKVNPKVEAIVENVVFWLLMALIVFVLVMDVLRLVVQLG